MIDPSQLAGYSYPSTKREKVGGRKKTWALKPLKSKEKFTYLFWLFLYSSGEERERGCRYVKLHMLLRGLLALDFPCNFQRERGEKRAKVRLRRARGPETTKLAKRARAGGRGLLHKERNRGPRFIVVYERAHNIIIINLLLLLYVYEVSQEVEFIRS